ncbi:MAG TPA: FAD-dependent monooxygenase [Streptosporangiaceae bacterium]|nr:FAD-dependent monooxygenase [Streptosporangiaceae bacterium]
MGLHVVVIGGGVGGLCLAQGLRNEGISATVYERDASAGSRHQGYRVSLKATGAGALRECLPEDLFALAVATSIRAATRMVFLDEHLRPKFDKPLPHDPPGPAGFGVNRLTLREILLAGLDVRFGKTFTHYSPTPDGRVAAHFADGSSAVGDLLAGADGTGSAVRRQLLPDAVIDELGWAVYGRTPFAGWVPGVLVDTFNRIIGPGGTSMSVATCRALEPASSAVARLAPSVRLSGIPGYFSWTLPLDGPRLFQAGAVSLHREAAHLVEGWHPAVRRIIAEADVPATFAVCITSAQPVAPWPVPNVTLLGDAVHTMSPGRGDGANVALKDAQVLVRALRRVAAGTASLASAASGYQAEMLQYGFQAVAASRDNPFMRMARR